MNPVLWCKVMVSATNLDEASRPAGAGRTGRNPCSMSCVGLKRLKLSYCHKETLLFTIFPYDGLLI